MDNLALFLQPAFGVLANAAIVLAVGAGVTFAQKHWNLKVNQSLVDEVDKAALDAAKVGYAKADASIDNAVLNESSPEVQRAASIVLTTVPNQLEKLGVTDEQVAGMVNRLVLSKFGQLQNTAGAAPAKAA